MSHFSFTRNSYDKCALDKKEQESADPGKWSLDDNVLLTKESCFMASAPFQHNPINSVPSQHVDIESELRGQTRDLSKCPSKKYNPNTTNIENPRLAECTNDRLVAQYTRIDKPCNLAGITINRFHPLCEDPQSLDKIHNNNFIGSNTRLQIKDSFKEKLTKEQSNKQHYLFYHDLYTPCDGCAHLIYNT